MAHGLGAVKEMYLEPFTRGFAEAALRRFRSTIVSSARAAGNRGRGSSRGTKSRITGALTWLSMQWEIDADRLGVLDTIFSGGQVLHVAALLLLMCEEIKNYWIKLLLDKVYQSLNNYNPTF